MSKLQSSVERERGFVASSCLPDFRILAVPSWNAGWFVGPLPSFVFHLDMTIANRARWKSAPLSGVFGQICARGDGDECRQMCFDKKALRATVQGREIALTPSEFALLRFLYYRRNETVSELRLLERALGTKTRFVTSRLRNHIASLRRKLGSQAHWLETVGPHRYRLRCPEARRTSPGFQLRDSLREVHVAAEGKLTAF